MIGLNTKIHESVEFIGEFKSIFIGDNVEIAEGVKILGGGELYIDDYTKINRNCFINARGLVKLGEGCWIGERTVLDGTGKLIAGNFLGVGINSSLYSHIRHGDVSEGSLYDRNSELVIGDDVWFVGECMVSPIIAKDKSMAMLGSVVIKDMEQNHMYGGNPAKDITDKTGRPWVDRKVEEKFNMVNLFIDDGCKQLNLDRETFKVVYEFPNSLDSNITYYNVSDRTYTKTNSTNEIKLNKWLLNGKAKFKKV